MILVLCFYLRAVACITAKGMRDEKTLITVRFLVVVTLHWRETDFGYM
jgi:hypothetical protein